MKQLIKTHGPNILHRYLIVKAEFSALQLRIKMETRQHQSQQNWNIKINHSYDKINCLYDEAIKSAMNCGNNQDAALCNELCGEFFAKMSLTQFGHIILNNTSITIADNDQDDKSNNNNQDHCYLLLAKRYLTNASDLYSEWGAKAKVDHLRTKWDSYIIYSK